MADNGYSLNGHLRCNLLRRITNDYGLANRAFTASRQLLAADSPFFIQRIEMDQTICVRWTKPFRKD